MAKHRVLLRMTLVWSSLFLLVGFAAVSAWCIDANGDVDVMLFSGWLPPVNLGWTINSTVEEVDPCVSKDGLSLYFGSRRVGGYGGFDIWISQRASVDEAWGPPQNLGSLVNTSADEASPFLSADGHRLYFSSTRSGGIGNGDLYVSRRHNNREDLGWRLPENLGSDVNTTTKEAHPNLFEDDASGVITLYFVSDRAGGLGSDDIYASTLQVDETFGPPVLVLELSSAAQDGKPVSRRDGLEMFMLSNRLGSIPNLLGAPSVDIWTSTRASTSDPWSLPVNLDPSGLLGINSNRHDGGPWLSFDGTTLYFHAAQRLGNNGFTLFDLWMTKRDRLTQSD